MIKKNLVFSIIIAVFSVLIIFLLINLQEILLITGITLICSLLAVKYKKEIGSWFNIYSILIFVYILGYPIRSYFILYFENKFSLSNEIVMYALIVSFICLIVFFIGNILGQKYSTEMDFELLPLNRRKKKIFIFINLILTIIPFLFLIINFGGLNNFLGQLSNRGQNFAGLSWAFTLSASFSISMIIIFANKTKINKLNFIILLLSSLATLFLLGSRIIFVLVLFPLITLYDYSKIKKMKFSVLLIISLIFLIFYASFFAYFRSFVPTGSWNHFTENYVDLLFNTIINGGLSFIDGLSVIMDKVPHEVNYLGGITVISAVLMYIPSKIFPDKPPNGAELYNLTFNYSQYSSGTGQNPSLFGELYWNFGPFFLILAIFFCGVVVGVLTKQVKKNGFKINYLSTVLLTFITPILILYLKSGLGTATSFRIIFPLFLILLQLIILKSIKKVSA